APHAIPQPMQLPSTDLVQDRTGRNMVLFSELRRIMAQLHEAGIAALPYKGPSLAICAYGGLSMRQPGDLDIVVPPADFARARAIIESLDHEVLEEDRDKSPEATPNEYHITLVNRERRIMIELHWQVMGKLFSFAPDPQDLWNRATPRDLLGEPMPVMSPEDTLLVLCAHGMKHFWTRLGWICDVAGFIEANPEIDWDLLLERAGRLGGRGMTLLGLLLAHRVLAAPVPERVLATARKSLREQADRLADHLFADAEQPDE